MEDVSERRRGDAPLAPAGQEPGLNAVRALQSLQERGHPAGWLAGDRAYTDAKPENFALRAKAMGYSAILDYVVDHLGVQGSHNGFLFIEGTWHCPAIPPVLINATIDVNNHDIDEATYRSRLAERMRHRALAKANEDVEGHRRWRCPASNPHPGASCPLKLESQHHDGRVMVTIRPTESLKANPPSCCVQGSVTIPPEPMAKLRQDLPYGTLEWEARYHALRNTIEGMNGYLKDGAREALDDSQRRRIRGVAAQSVFVALLVFAANYRKIVEFMRLVGVEGGSRRRSRRRASRPISDWYPEPAGVPHGPEPPPSL